VPDRLKRFLIAGLMAVLLLNIWTGGPLLALWLGSRVQGTGPPSMGAVVVVLLALGVICAGLYQALQATNRRYNELTGTEPTVRDHAPWLRSMRGERPEYDGMRRELPPAERIMVGGVLVTVALFEVWFFFFSGSSIGAG
jgi:hypothetical protein